MKGQPLYVLREVDFLIFLHLHDNRFMQVIANDHPSFTKAASRLFFSIAICKQLNAAPYLGGVHGITLGHYNGRDSVPCSCSLVNPWFYMCTSLASRPMTEVFVYVWQQAVYNLEVVITLPCLVDRITSPIASGCMQWSSSALVNLISIDQLFILDNIISYNVFHFIEHRESVDVPLQIDALPCEIKQDDILAALMQLLSWVCLCVLNNSHFLYCTFIHASIYRSLVKKGLWAVHIT